MLRGSFSWKQYHVSRASELKLCNGVSKTFFASSFPTKQTDGDFDLSNLISDFTQDSDSLFIYFSPIDEKIHSFHSLVDIGNTRLVPKSRLLAINGVYDSEEDTTCPV